MAVPSRVTESWNDLSPRPSGTIVWNRLTVGEVKPSAQDRARPGRMCSGAVGDGDRLQAKRTSFSSDKRAEAG